MSTSTNPFAPHTEFPRFTKEQIEKQCYLIFGQSFEDMSDPDKQLLTEEYSRLKQLPSISLISGINWADVTWDEKNVMYNIANTTDSDIQFQ